MFLIFIITHKCPQHIPSVPFCDLQFVPFYHLFLSRKEDNIVVQNVWPPYSQITDDVDCYQVTVQIRVTPYFPSSPTYLLHIIFTRSHYVSHLFDQLYVSDYLLNVTSKHICIQRHNAVKLLFPDFDGHLWANFMFYIAVIFNCTYIINLFYIICIVLSSPSLAIVNVFFILLVYILISQSYQDTICQMINYFSLNCRKFRYLFLSFSLLNLIIDNAIIQLASLCQWYFFRLPLS